MISAGLQGFIMGLGLIIAIGAQNVFVLKAGLLRLPLTARLFDLLVAAIMISVGFSLVFT